MIASQFLPARNSTINNLELDIFCMYFTEFSEHEMVNKLFALLRSLSLMLDLSKGPMNSAVCPSIILSACL